MNQKEIKLSVGEWKTRGGEKALVEYEHKGVTYLWRGYIGGVPHAWLSSGRYYSDAAIDDKDIVEPWVSPIAPGHNPDDLTVKQVGERYILHRPKFIATLNRTAWNHVDRWNERFGVWEKVGGNVCYESSFFELETYRSEFSEEQLRILATSKKRLIRVDELPPVCWVAFGDSKTQRTFVDQIDLYHQTISFRDRCLTLHQMVNSHGYWSSDLKTWNSFEVEDKQ